MPDLAALDDLCRSFPGSVETFPFGEQRSVYKVGGRIFAIIARDAEPLQLSLKCEPGLAEQLREAHPAIRPGWHLSKRHWNTLTLDGSLGERMIRDLVEDSYDLICSALPRARREGLRWPGAGQM